jgi:hypothetical protein
VGAEIGTVEGEIPETVIGWVEKLDGGIVVVMKGDCGASMTEGWVRIGLFKVSLRLMRLHVRSKGWTKGGSFVYVCYNCSSQVQRLMRGALVVWVKTAWERASLKWIALVGALTSNAFRSSTASSLLHLQSY